MQDLGNNLSGLMLFIDERIGEHCMFPTVEVRWFNKGVVNPRVLNWFQKGKGKLEEQPARVDYYLRVTDGGSLGIKLREGRIEVKQRYHKHGVVRFHKRIAGLVEHWRKWSFELAERSNYPAGMAIPASSWVEVEKERIIRRYRITNQGNMEVVSARAYCDWGCDLELTSISVEGEQWWSLGFESFGDEIAIREGLILVVKKVLAAEEPPAFNAEDSYGYPKWLAVR
jgi:hypothetical protein